MIIIQAMKYFAMKHIWVVLVLGLLLGGCHLSGYQYSQTPVTTSETLQSFPSSLPSQTPGTTSSPTPEVLPATPPPVATQENNPDAALNGDDFSIRYHPDGPLYIGDRVSVEVIPQPGLSLAGRQLILKQAESQEQLGSANFEPFGIGGRQQATLTWVWNTAGLSPGDYELTFSVPASNAQESGGNWNETVTLLPADQEPAPEPQASWENVESDCCNVFYITGTDAARDLEDLIEMAETEAQAASQQLKTDFTEKIPITFLPRVIGHGGFAGDDISISYLDRDYAGGDIRLVLHHEMAHLLDGRLDGAVRPSLLVEGLAVYLSGGHFKKEPLMPRAAALLAPQQDCVEVSSIPEGASPGAIPCSLNNYIPLRTLFNDFYFAQHEIGYLEAGALIEYMVDRWGWEKFDAFYRDIQPINDAEGKPLNSSPVEEVDGALLNHFGISLDELEEQFLSALSEETLLPTWVEDVRLTVAYYDTVRRYQQFLDPSAYFLNAWILDNKTMRKEEIVADYLRRPSAQINVRLEELLVQADQMLRNGNYTQVQVLLDEVNHQLDQFARIGGDYAMVDR
jgi:hypothetical protein